MLLGFCEVGVQSVQPGFPNGPLAVEPVSGNIQRSRHEAIGSNPPRLPGFDQAAIFQHGEMLGKRRQGHFEWLRQLTDRRRTDSQPLEDCSPGGIGQALKDAIQARLVRHLP